MVKYLWEFLLKINLFTGIFERFFKQILQNNEVPHNYFSRVLQKLGVSSSKFLTFWAAISKGHISVVLQTDTHLRSTYEVHCDIIRTPSDTTEGKLDWRGKKHRENLSRWHHFILSLCRFLSLILSNSLSISCVKYSLNGPLVQTKCNFELEWILKVHFFMLLLLKSLMMMECNGKFLSPNHLLRYC